jgi:hypothetical protein
MKSDVYPDVKGNIGPDVSSIDVQQKVIMVNGMQKVVEEQHPALPFHTLKCINGCCTLVSKNDLKPIMPKKEKHVCEKCDFTPKAFKCAAKGYIVGCNGHKKRAHILSRQAQQIKAEPMNILDLCESHERWFNKQPLKIWYRFVREHYPQNFNYVKVKVRFLFEQTGEYLEVAEEQEASKEKARIESSNSQDYALF